MQAIKIKEFQISLNKTLKRLGEKFNLDYVSEGRENHLKDATFHSRFEVRKRLRAKMAPRKRILTALVHS